MPHANRTTTGRRRASGAGASGQAPVAPLSVSGISKTYGPVRALLPTSFDLVAGEVHALVGENGSGKSTVVKILSGVIAPDEGTVSFNGRSARRHTPWESQGGGVLTVYQDGTIYDDLTVAQNLYVGVPASFRPSYRRLNAWAHDRLSEFGLSRLTPNARAGSFSPGDRQLLDIARAAMAHPPVLLLDEATSALDAAGVNVALDLMRRAAADGCAVMFVTHRLSEVFRVATRVSILRDGEWQGTRPASELDQPALVNLMAGSVVDHDFPDRAATEEVGQELLVARELRGLGYGPVDIAVRSGEIVGIAGADNNGQIGLLRGLAGLNVLGGSLSALGSPVSSLRSAMKLGVGLLSADRRNESLFPSLAIRENLVSGILSKLSHGGFISGPRERRATSRAVDQFGIRLGSPEDPVTSLSGGNQQKVALSRLLSTEPKVVLVDEPTQGVDVRSRVDIYRTLRTSAQSGAGVVVLSSDAAELAGLCDRINVMSRGRVVAEIAGAEASEERIVRAFAGAEQGEAEAQEASVVESVGRRLRRLVGSHEEIGRTLLLVVLLVALSLYTQSRNGSFLTTPSIYNVLLTALPLTVVAAAEFAVMFVGGIDVSVGATMGLMVATMSFVVQSSGAATGLLISLLLAVGLGLVIGGVNSTLVERIRISPVIATIATLGILQGVGLKLRPQAAGLISPSIINALTKDVGGVPIALIVVAALMGLSDALLRFTGRGVRLRSIGLNPQFAYSLGQNASRVRQISYVLCAVLAAIAGATLAAQVGTGDSTVGSQYTLVAIAAPIIGGASLFGGRGTFLGCLLGSILLALTQSLPTVLALRDGTDFLLTGILTLLALVIFTSGIGTTIRLQFRGLLVAIRGAGPSLRSGRQA